MLNHFYPFLLGCENMLIKAFNLIDIKKYEIETGDNILEYFNNFSILNMLNLISLGNNNCDLSKASDILDSYLKENKTILDAILEIKKNLIGIGDNEDIDIDEEDTVNIKDYNSLTDLYISYSMQLMSVGLTYNEFWSMNTKEMYKVFNSIQIKLQNETNRELSNYHTLAAMVGSAVWGKLQRDAPKIDIVKHNREVDDMDEDSALLVAKLGALAAKHNKREEMK